MRRLFSVMLLLLASCELHASEASPSTLREAISVAIRLNPRTRSTDEFLESIHYATRTLRASFLPSGELACGLNATSNETNSRPLLNSRSQSVYGSCYATASQIIYDGGASRARYQAGLARERATRNAYNTSDSLITNTRGALASATMNTFLQLVTSYRNIAYYQDILETYKVLEKFSVDQTLLTAIVDNKTALNDFELSIASQNAEFKFYTTREPSDKLESLDDMIQTLKIPPLASEALKIALANGPEILRRNAGVEAEQANLKAVRATYGPQLYASVTTSKSFYAERISRNSSSSTVRSAGLTLSFPLSFGKRDAVRAADSATSAAKLERDAAIESARYTISSSYQSLQQARESLVILEQNYRDQVVVVKNILKKINAGDTADLDITKILSATSVLGNRFDLITFKKQRIIQLLFSIQQITGLLFSDFVQVSADKN